MNKIIKYLAGLTKGPTQKRRKEIIDDTIKYFTSNTRALLDGKCVYSPIEGVSEGCAVGRLIKDKELCKKFDETREGVCNLNIWSKLPVDVQKLGDKFLQDLQFLHDTSDCWTVNGLSERGLDLVERMREEHT